MANRKMGLTAPVIVLIAVVLVIANTALGFVLARQSEQALGEQVQARMLDIACSAAELLDGDSLENLTAQDQGTPAYEQAMDTLRAFQDSVDLSYIYCARQVGEDSFEFTVDPTVADPAEFGEPVKYTEALGKAARGVASVDLVAYSDRWGSFYSAYAPVFDSAGEVASIVGVDFNAAWYEERTDQINHLVMVSCLALLVMALLAILVAARLARAQERHMQSLLKASRFDPLTGLCNMSYFFERASEVRDGLVAQGEEPVILYMDLVDMKYFNQKYGFAEGDRLLKAFADLLVERFGDGRSSRFGQDHFVAITIADDLEARLGALAADSEGLLAGRGLPVCTGICVGAYKEMDIHVACDRAKVACSMSDGAYRSSWRYFDDAMLAEVEQRQYFIDNLDRAIAENWIKVYYQPIVRASNGHVCDEEALARWVDPERGVVSPAEFIPALEGAKLIYKLDLNVLEQTLDKMRRLADEGLFIVPASVNLSRSDFETCDIVEEVRKRVDAAGVSHEMINVEITETALGRNFEFMKMQVERFHELGFQVWMDDFGSEYSSLDYLQNLRFDLIKFDMQFMRQFDNGEKSKVILTELVKMAVGLQIDTIVEGVETAEQVSFLREVGCSKMQGFYFSEPHPLEGILKRYEDGSAIGFENPAESDYYSALGRVNLYDLSSVAREEDEGMQRYFNTLPMAIIEFAEDGFTMIRCNQSYRGFMAEVVGGVSVGAKVSYEEAGRIGGGFLRAARECNDTGDRLVIDESMPDGTKVHALARRIAVNPVSGTVAVVVAVLAIADAES